MTGVGGHCSSFAAATLLICAVPGPNMLYVMTSAVRHGFRRSVYSMAGCFSAVMILISLSVAGLGAVLKAFPALFDGLRWGGAAYLIYLGIQAWRAPADASMADGEMDNAREMPAARLFRRGFAVGISNPKALLFAAAFFPQFIDPGLPGRGQLAALLAIFALCETGCYLAYAAGGRQLATLLNRADTRRWFNRLTGTFFCLFGALMLGKMR